jgi:hypothetical protein
VQRTTSSVPPPQVAVQLVNLSIRQQRLQPAPVTHKLPVDAITQRVALRQDLRHHITPCRKSHHGIKQQPQTNNMEVRQLHPPVCKVNRLVA